MHFHRMPDKAAGGSWSRELGSPGPNHRLRHGIGTGRSRQGSVLPLVVVSLMVLIAFLGASVDLMRNSVAVLQLQHAAEAAALYGYSYATNQDGSYSSVAARSNITQAVLAAGASGNTWNVAQAGPTADGSWVNGVSFSSQDISIINNPNPADNQELFLQVKAWRSGSDAIKMFFLPALYALNVFGGTIPSDVLASTPYRVCEVIGQPASRVGSGPPLSATPGTRAGDLVGFAALPIGISNQQFLAASDPNQTLTIYAGDLVASDASLYTQPEPPGRFKAALVNVVSANGTSTSYGSGQGDGAIDQLIESMNYFSGQTTQPVMQPALVERGSQLAAFDPADPVFVQRKSEILSAISQLPVNRFYMVPVFQNDPSFSGTNMVVGFARLQLLQAVSSSGSDFALSFGIGDSVPVRNASHANGWASVPTLSGALMPKPVAPFQDRTFDQLSNTVSQRPRGLVLAPAISPRSVSPGPS